MLRRITARGRHLLTRAGILTDEWSMEEALQRAAATISVRSIIDVGASNGSWSRMAQRVWPDTRSLLIEAQRGHLAALQRSGMEFVLAAAGDRVGQAYFDATDLLSGVASHAPTGGRDILVAMTTVDAEVKRVSLQPPHLLKLDTHGFEREIFVGATHTLDVCSLLVVEAYNFELRPGAMRFHELCAFLDERGFQCLDVADPLHRPTDGALWQFDLIFARSDRPEFGDVSYQ